MLVLRKLVLLAALSSSCTIGAATAATTQHTSPNDEESNQNHLRSLTQTTTTTHLVHDENVVKPPSNTIPLTTSTTTITSPTSTGSYTKGKKKVETYTYDNMAADLASTTTTTTSTTTSKFRPSLNSIGMEESDGTSSSRTKNKSPTKPAKTKKRYVVQCATGYSIEKCEEEILNTSSSVKIVNSMPNTDMFAVEMDEEQSVEISLKSHIDHLEDDPIRYLLDHRDPTASNQEQEEEHNNDNMNLRHRRDLAQNTAYGISNVNAQVVWEAYKGQVGTAAAKGSRAKVCIIDTGIRKSHNDLDDARLFGSNVAGLTWDIDADGHGSHVAGIVGASDNTRGVVGVSPEADLHIVRVFDSNGVFASDMVSAMEECARSGAKVISMSLGGTGRSWSEERATQQLFDSGVILVAAAGNSGDGENPVEYPAAYKSVISVGAADANRNIASFSTHNDQLNLAAPGVDIRSLGTRNNNDYRSLSGTSMACPHVAGVAALLFSIFNTATSQQVRDALQNSAQGLGQCGNDEKYGYGHVDAKAAADLLQLGGTPAAARCNPTVVTIRPDQYGSETTWRITNSKGVPIAGGGPYRDGRTSNEVTQLNLPELPWGECYKFTIFDAQNDGLCCDYGEGSYGLTFSGAAVTASSTFTGSQDTKEFGCNNGSNPSPSPVCGNGIVEAGEECDDGDNNNGNGCSNQCTINSGSSNPPPAPVCGNGIREAGEECDDGDNSNTNACTNACKNNVCGDGFVFAGVEACDEGSNNGSGDCDNDCTRKKDPCGDSAWERFWNQLLGRC